MQINIIAPEFQTNIFLALFIVLLLATTVRRSINPTFTIDKTQELKGFAILTIIFGHIGYFLSTNDHFLYPLSILSGVGVNLFLFLSGYGLTLSQLSKPLTALQFYSKRLLKLYLPLFITIAVFFFLDYLFLQRNYGFQRIFLSFIGFYPDGDIIYGFNSPLWYFTFILFYYLIFPLMFFNKRPIISSIIIYILSLVLLHFNFFLPIHSDVLKLYQLHLLAFPLGMICASLHKHNMFSFLSSFHHRLKTLFNINSLKGKVFYTIFLISISVIVSYFAIYSGVGESIDKEQILSILMTSLIIVLFLYKNFQFKLLHWFGKYSYEIYLIHWPILIRYHFLYNYLPAYLATLIYILLILLLAKVLQICVARITFERKLSKKALI